MRFVVAAPLFALVALGGNCLPLEVPLTVAEPVGVARQAEPATGGVPFKKGQVKDVAELALFDKAGNAVPAQFAKLAPYEDGSVQWVLVDFLATVPASGKAEFAVKPGQAAAPARPLTIVENDAITVDTGAAKFTVNTTQFNLLESVELDGKKVAGGGSVDIVEKDGKVYKAGKPSKVSWEYRGPLRATLRVEGPYLGEAGTKYLAYTTRFTFWAGLSAVRVNHSVRNSNPKEGDDAKIREASLSIDFKGAEQDKGPGWVAAGDGAAGVLLTHQHTGGCFPAKEAAFTKVQLADGKLTAWVIPPGKGVKGTPGYGDGFFALADCAHKDSQVWLDFYSGARDAAAAGARAKALAAKLLAMPDGAWISETEAFGPGKFGTLQDEVNTYKKWGWKGWENKIPRAPYRPDAYVSSEAIHDESESDCAELSMLMYARTGERGFFDQAESWARYYKTHYAYRTDGFDRGKGRINKGLKFGWYDPPNNPYGWTDSRLDKCHFWGRGLLDYYCLTGDVDALEGGRDLVRNAINDVPKIGGNIGDYGVRSFAREWLIVLRLAQLTRDPKDREPADRYAEAFLKAKDWDDRGFVNWGGGISEAVKRSDLFPDKNPRLKQLVDEKGVTIAKNGQVTAKDGSKWTIKACCPPFHYAELCLAMERYWRLTGNDQIKARRIKIAEFARDNEWSHKCELCLNGVVMDFPEKGKNYDPWAMSAVHDTCPGPGATHNGYESRFLVDIFAGAYAFTGDQSWLDWAKRAYNRGYKRGYQTTKQEADDDEVYTFARHRPPKGDDYDIRSCSRMFYEVPRAR